jgi:hypothetical protein
LSLVAIAAIDGFVPSWLEGYLRLVAAARTRCGIHLAWFAGTAASAIVAALSFARGAALWTATGCVCQTATGVKFLFAHSKYEFLIAVSTNQGLIT